LTVAAATRYVLAMKTRNPWLLGLQWGAWAWLGYINVLTLGGLLVVGYMSYTGHEPPPWANHWSSVSEGLPQDAAWIVSFALIAAGSRWARLAVAVAIAGQCAVSLGWWGRGWVPMCAPLLPLVVLRLEEPRVVLALLALGRWREALARSGGVRAALVAAGVVSLNHALLELF